MNLVRRFLQALAGLVFFGAGIWGFILLAGPVYRGLSGYIGYFAGPLMLVLAPVIAPLAPVYYGITQGWWLPLIVCYGGAAVAFGLYVLSGLGKEA